MGANLLRHKQPGQSMILVVMVLAVLIGLVGLSVDVGRAYAAQRAAQRAVNSAAIKGADSLIRNRADRTIYQDMIASLKANGIDVAEGGQGAGDDQLAMRASYLDAQGNYVADVGATSNQNAAPGANVTYISVKLDGNSVTYLAKLFGQNTLPVKVNSYGGRAPCVQDMYPYVVKDSAFTGTAPGPSGRYTDDRYTDLPWRRIYDRDNSGIPGNFSWVRWLADNSSGSNTAMAAALTYPGTLKSGFDEVPWPNNSTGAGTKPQGYPILKGYLNAQDWVYASSGDNQGGVASQLSVLKTQRVELLLPMFDVANGSGANGIYHITKIGRFLLKDFGREQGKSYMDLVFIGESNGCPTLINPPTPPNTQFDLVGKVQVKPRTVANTSDYGPVDVVVVLDTSVSMAWNWAGTTNTSSSNPPRLDVAKSQLKTFIDGFMTPEDRMAIVRYDGRTGYANGAYPATKTINSYTESEKRSALDSLTSLLSDWKVGDPAGKSALKTSVDTARAGGNTPSVVGLERGKRQLQSARATFNGKKVRKVIIFMTDGVANTYLDGKFRKCNDGGTVTERCIGEMIAEGQPADIVGDLAGQMKAAMSEELQIYVIGMGADLNTVGLDRVASEPAPPYNNAADQLTDMQPIFNQIRSTIDNSTSCTPVEEDWQAPVDVSRLADDQSIGTVKLYDASSNALVGTANIYEQAGEAYYQFSNIKSGQYTVQATIKYRDVNTGQMRTYNIINVGGNRQTKLNFNVDTSGVVGSTYGGPSMNMVSEQNVCGNGNGS